MKTRQPYVTLAASNDDPRPNLYECAAEQLQSVESDEGQARMWGMLWAVAIGCFIAGCLATAALALCLDYLR